MNGAARFVQKVDAFFCSLVYCNYICPITGANPPINGATGTYLCMVGEENCIDDKIIIRIIRLMKVAPFLQDTSKCKSPIRNKVLFPAFTLTY